MVIVYRTDFAHVIFTCILLVFWTVQKNINKGAHFTWAQNLKQNFLSLIWIFYNVNE